MVQVLLSHFMIYNKTHPINKTRFLWNTLTYPNVLQTPINSDNLSLTQGHWESAKLGHTCNWKECGLPGLAAPYHGDRWEVKIYPNPLF